MTLGERERERPPRQLLTAEKNIEEPRRILGRPLLPFWGFASSGGLWLRQDHAMLVVTRKQVDVWGQKALGLRF